MPDVRAIFSVDDFPAYLQMQGISRTVYTRTTVPPDGTIDSCVIETSSGDRNLDNYTCGLIVKRAKFQPATWTDGQPVYGVIRVPVSWRISNYPPSEADVVRAMMPDIDLTVSRLPKGAGSATAFSLEIAADVNGHAVTCAEYPAAFTPGKKHFPELVTIGCQQAMASFIAVPPVDASGKPVRSVQTVSVRFTKSH